MTLAERPVRTIVGAITDAAARWCDADFPPRVGAAAAVRARTGYSSPVVEYALDRLFSPLTRAAIEAAIVSELGSLEVLDGFAQCPGLPRVRALPIGRVCIISSRTTIGVALLPAIFALCAKCDVLVKDREDHLCAAFFSTLAEELDELRSAASAQAWDGEADARDLAAFDSIVAFGSDAAIASIRREIPFTARTIAYGPKASAGYIGRDALSDPAQARDLARRAARDLVLYESEGCLSLHALFVERGGRVSPEQFGVSFAAAVEEAAVEFPPAAQTARTTSRIASARDLAAFRASGGRGRVFSDSSASYLAVLDWPPQEPPLLLPRAIGMLVVDGPAQAASYLAHHGVSIEAMAVAGKRADVTEMAAAVGAARIAAFGTLQSPLPQGRHGGRPRIAEFVRWMTDET